MFADALSALADPLYWGLVVGGLLALTLLTLTPGLSGTLVAALAIPFIVNAVESDVGIALVAGVAGAVSLGGSLQAVLFGLPGSVTFLEGHRLARQGRASHTLGALYAAAAFSSLLGVLAMLLLLPVAIPLAGWTSGWEQVWLAALPLSFVLALLIMSTGALVKGFAAAGVGVLFSTIGVAGATGETRFTFGLPELETGLPLGTVTLGIIVLPELIDLSLARRAVAPPGAVLDTREALRGAGYALRRWPMLLRQSAFGALFRVMPMPGSVDWLAYALGVALSKDKSKFGKGSLDGALFAEAAQHSRAPGALPTMLLGIPSSRGWAFVMVAMVAYGVAPGPRLLEEQAHLFILIAIALAIGAVIVALLGVGLAGPFGKLTRIPYPLIGGFLIPVTILLTLVAYESVRLVFPALAVFTGVGILMKVFRWPRWPLLLGFTSSFFYDRVIDERLLSTPQMIDWLLAGAATVVAVAATAAFARSDWHRSRSGGSAPPPSADDVGDGLLRRLWRPRNALPLLALSCGLAFLVGSVGLDSVRMSIVPGGAALLVIALALTQLALHLRERGERRAEVLDLGMHSIALPGVRRAAWLTAGGFVMFALLTSGVGARWGALALAAYLPLALLGRGALPLRCAVAASAVAGGLSGLAALLIGSEGLPQVVATAAAGGIAAAFVLGIDAEGQGGAPNAPVAVGVVALALAVVAAGLHLSEVPDSPLGWGLRFLPGAVLALLLAPFVRRAQPSPALEWLFTWRAQGTVIAVSVVALSIYALNALLGT